MSPPKTDNAPADAAAKAKPLIKLVETYGDAFSRAGNHALHSKLNDVVISAASLKRTIAEVRGKVPAELAAALSAVDALL